MQMTFVLNMKLVIKILHTYIKFQGIGFVYSTSVAENLGCLYSRLLCQQQDFIQKSKSKKILAWIGIILTKS